MLKCCNLYTYLLKRIKMIVSQNFIVFKNTFSLVQNLQSV